MFPLKDTLRAARPPALTLALVVVTLAAIVVWDAPTVPFLLAAWALWIAGRSTEDSVSRKRFVLFCGATAAAAIGVDSLAGSASGTTRPLIALLGVAGGVTGAYMTLYPRARIQTLILVPLFSTVVETPVALLTTLWLGLQIALPLTNLGEDLAWWTPVAAMACGAALFLPLGPRRNPAYERDTGGGTASVPPS